MAGTILIADSGSTKTDWRIIAGDGSIQQASSSGLNPYHLSSEEMALSLQHELLPHIRTVPAQIHFYGAGCANEAAAARVQQALSALFASAQIHVYNDLLGAARALCGHEAGIACILGTGANTCVYDGQQVTDNLPPLGYILGDEGSGAHIGKELLSRYFRRDLPDDIRQRLEKRFDVTQSTVLDHVYRQPLANRYLAGFSKFVFQNIQQPYLMRMVYTIFTEFFDQTVARYENYQQYKLHFTGSVAFYYSNLLRQVASDKGIRIFNIVESPIAGLTLFHQAEL